ncbi:EscU/YscU/HrcU family type III secretion system export apparatus switch protein [Aromatoleum sp.]|uniref:EscU/YscU/HrcU family type III secretion system export apparatus switch protein n=1 Tax=Aromatoleum sp. TaxID=2307007 RepID=UPI002FC59024
MAENSTGDKTEKASAQKLKKSREQGQVARSKDWSTMIGIVVCLQLVSMLAPGYLEDFRELFHLGFATLDADGAHDNVWSNAFSTSMLLLLKMVLPLFVVPATVALGALFPGGWVLSVEQLKPKLERLSPLSYFRRIFKLKHAIEVASAMFKAIALLVVLYHVSRSMVPSYLALQSQSLNDALAHGAALMLDGVLALCAVFVLFALIDLPVQSMVFLRDQRMTKRDVKEEYKTSEGRPEVRQRVRQLQQQIARRSVRKAVPTADVVVVNPEHYAVALKYDDKRAEAPFLVAKGVDEMALYIRELAAEHGVEVVSMPPLARAIYNTTQVHQQIPAQLYKAVAQVLTYVLQLAAFRGGRRNALPQLPHDLAVPPHLA